jgi:hypothetical protein
LVRLFWKQDNCSVLHSSVSMHSGIYHMSTRQQKIPVRPTRVYGDAPGFVKTSMFVPQRVEEAA